MEFLKNSSSQKALILTLIQADLKHNQLISGFEQLDLETSSYFLDLHKPVALLMGTGENPSEQWFQIYARYLQNTNMCRISGKPDSLLLLAEEY